MYKFDTGMDGECSVTDHGVYCFLSMIILQTKSGGVLRRRICGITIDCRLIIRSTDIFVLVNVS